ncbi:hypothetical protein [Verrucosispora sioxanthis]|uniref:hypothetical protein n=1 Tax=Verrucosispora sioxanthis TaxID=2499994 RepID=UPI0020A0D42B|nr:hypothetical protein [Verrucosispora sioxanthis]
MANTTISRRTLLTTLAGVGAATLVGCDSTPAAADPLPDPLLVTLDGGLTVLRGTDRPTEPTPSCGASTPAGATPPSGYGCRAGGCRRPPPPTAPGWR